MHGRSPKGARKRDGLDVEAAGGMAEVQKEQESVTDWTLKLRRIRAEVVLQMLHVGHATKYGEDRKSVV